MRPLLPRVLPAGQLRPVTVPGEGVTMWRMHVYEFFRRKLRIIFLTGMVYAALC